MTRRPRLVVAGQPLHVIQRGHNRAATFLQPADYDRYRDILGESSRRCACAVHAYVLMTNHVHLLITPEREAGPARMMQMIGRRYVQYINVRYARSGTLWEGRYRSALIDSETYLLACSRYIELNPVRARLVDVALRYPWSSYGHNAEGRSDELITEHPLYLALGRGPIERRAVYRALFSGAAEPDAAAAIRRAVNRGRFQPGLPTPFTHGGDRRGRGYHSLVQSFQRL